MGRNFLQLPEFPPRRRSKKNKFQWVIELVEIKGWPKCESICSCFQRFILVKAGLRAKGRCFPVGFLQNQTNVISKRHSAHLHGFGQNREHFLGVLARAKGKDKVELPGVSGYPAARNDACRCCPATRWGWWPAGNSTRRRGSTGNSGKQCGIACLALLYVRYAEHAGPLGRLNMDARSKKTCHVEAL